MPRVNPPLPISTKHIMEVVFQYGQEGQIYENVYHLETDGATLASTEEGLLATAFASGVVGAYAVVWHNLTLCIGAIVRSLDVPSRVASFRAQVGGGVGGNFPLPGPVGGILRKLTDIRGQHGRGRNYIGGLDSAMINPGGSLPDFLSAAGTAGITGIGTTIMGGFVVATSGNVWMPCLVYNTGTPSAPVLRSRLLNNAIANNVLGTVRRRRFGRGI